MDSTESSSSNGAANGPWWRELNRYHWFVFIVASLGWLFDAMDQRIFLISRRAALTELLGYQRGDHGLIETHHGIAVAKDQMADAEGDIKWYSGLATSIFIIGWATGGLFFGIMGDRWGRARTMLLTILIYSIFTGLSALSQHWWDFMIYRFITGLGVGGEFAAGVALVAEVMPNRARPYALGLLQALTFFGNIAGSMMSLIILPYGWQYMFLMGTVPALLVVLVRRRLQEPETWVSASTAKDTASQSMGSVKEMFSDPRWRRHTIIGVLLTLTGVIGLWGVGFWSFELMDDVLQQQGYDKGQSIRIRGVGSMLLDVGTFFGLYGFGIVTGMVGRRLAFAGSFVVAFASIILVFGYMQTETQIYWMMPLLGFGILAPFAGYAIYYPELFPTRLRSTGTAFCYNVARYLAAVGPWTFGKLVLVYGGMKLTFLGAIGGVDGPPIRYAAVTLALVYFFGLLVLPFAPETKGKPLPE